MDAKKINQRRRMLINPKLQLPLLTWSVVFIVLFTIAFAFALYSYVEYKASSHISIAMRGIYMELLRTSLIMIVGVIVMGCVTLYAFGIYFSHRIAGPLVPIKRCLDELINGNIHAPDIKLRDTDELKDLADKINQLKEKIAKKLI